MNIQNEIFFSSPYPGEMLPYERYKLYNWILEIKPEIIFEVGTGNGGGSTFYIAEALKKGGINGFIYTCDPIRVIDSKFTEKYTNVFYHKLESNLVC
jgi:NAD(P)H-hydrate repair Nnr-like enzyme with NAD(P)H-hydrate epimerase domain